MPCGRNVAVFVGCHLADQLELGGDAQRCAGDGFFLLPHDRRAIGALLEPIIFGGVVSDLVDLFQDVLDQALLRQRVTRRNSWFSAIQRRMVARPGRTSMSPILRMVLPPATRSQIFSASSRVSTIRGGPPGAGIGTSARHSTLREWSDGWSGSGGTRKHVASVMGHCGLFPWRPESPTLSFFRTPLACMMADCSLSPRSRAPFAMCDHCRRFFCVLAFLVFPPASSDVQADPRTETSAQGLLLRVVPGVCPASSDVPTRPYWRPVALRGRRGEREA
jgi:hypothetical protein